MGIWKDVELVVADRCRLGDVRVETRKIADGICDIALHIELEWLVRRKGACVISGRVGNHEFSFGADLSEGRRVITKKLSLEEIGLWYPRPYGPQDLHDVVVRVEDRSGLLDRRTFRTGFRKIELIQDKRPEGCRTFEFRCNGEPLFVTGFNWTPLDAIFARVTPQKVTDRLEELAKIGCNMLRIWGGGIYESAHFFNECDRLGILVWQDFMMAGGWFPQGREFARAMAREAKQVVCGIRNHPCIALYAGDNEIYQMLYREAPEYRKLINNNAITEKTLRNVCRRYDPHVPYLPSSPYSPTGKDHNVDRQGDAHRYVHGQSYRASAIWNSEPRFLSEFGWLSLPSVHTIKKYFPPGDEWPLTSRCWKYHSSNTVFMQQFRGMDHVLRGIDANGRELPENIDQAVRVTQELQAEAVGAWIEHFSGQPDFSGFLLWNVSDCWPEMSDAVMFYEGEKKAVFHRLEEIFTAARREHDRRTGKGAK